MSTQGHELETINVKGLKKTMQDFKTKISDKKSDKTATVSDVSFDSSTGKLRKTINGDTSNVCDIVTSGFRITTDETTGTDIFTAVGGATVSHNNTTGADEFAF